MALSNEEKVAIVKEYGALRQTRLLRSTDRVVNSNINKLSKGIFRRINTITHSRIGLLRMVSQRRKLLNYLM